MRDPSFTRVTYDTEQLGLMVETSLEVTEAEVHREIVRRLRAYADKRPGAVFANGSETFDAEDRVYRSWWMRTLGVGALTLAFLSFRDDVRTMWRGKALAFVGVDERDREQLEGVTVRPDIRHLAMLRVEPADHWRSV